MRYSAIKNKVLLAVLLGLICTSCTGYSPGPGQPVAAPGEYEPADAACAYFYFLWGKSAEFGRRYEEALEAYEKVLLCDENNDKVIKDLAVLLVKMNRKPEAVAWFQKIIAKDPDDLGSRRLLARLYTSMGKVNEAVALYDYILAKNEDEQTLLLLSSLYARDGRNDKSLEVLKRVVRRDKDSYMGHYNLARLYRELKVYKKAVASYRRAMRINWSAALAYEVAEYYEHHDSFAESIELYKRVLSEDDTEYSARTRLINVYLVSDQDDLALAELKKLKAFLPGHHTLDLTVARILISQKKYDEAITLISARLKEKPEESLARFMLGQVYYRKGDFGEARKVLGAITPSDQEYEDSILTIVRSMHEEKDLAGAIRLLREKLAEVETRKLSFYVVLASLFRDDNQVEEGRAVFDEAMQVYPENAELLFEYGMFLERIGEQEGALVKMKQVLVLEPENSSALNYVGYTWADNDMNLEKAFEYIEKASALKPEDGYIRDSLGWVYFKLGDTARAVSELEKAVELAVDDAVIHEHLGDAYLKAGSLSKALKVYKKALELYKEDDKKDVVRLKIEELKTLGTNDKAIDQ